MLFFLVFLTGFAIFSFYLTVLKPLPDYSDTVRLEGLMEEVRIHRGEYGVPQIYAENEQDLFFAVGYVHAQDRMWQMTLSQLAAEGRFAEFLGEDLVPYDRYQRTLGFWRTAGEIEKELSEPLRNRLQWYADGVNAWAALNERNLPLEFSLLKMTPIEWTPRHTIAISRLMAWDQNINWWSELTLAWLEQRIPEARMREIVPEYESFRPITGMVVQHSNDVNAPTGESLQKSDESAKQSGESVQKSLDQALAVLDLEHSFRTLMGKQGTSIGSNAWVASGDRTQSGQPLLAGDPHMGLSMPGNWYEANLVTPEFQISGAMIPGAPFVVLGQNQHLAWSLTNIMADDTDFFLERLSPRDSTLVITLEEGGKIETEPLQLIRERIQVKDGGDVIHTVRLTPNGPLINDIYPSQGLVDGELISVRWTGHQVSFELQALYEMNRATNLEEFRTAASKFKSPGMNAMYADKVGNIAMFPMAGLPKRTETSLFFRRGWIPQDQWPEVIPFDELPSVVNPEKGWIANANNKIHDDRYPYYIGTFWEPSSRIERLHELFALHEIVNADLFSDWQLDIVSPHARELLEIVLPVLIERSSSAEPLLEKALPYLLNWDYKYELSSTAASIMDAFVLSLVINTLEDELGEEAYENFVRLENLPVRSIIRLLTLNSPLFDDERTEAQESRDEMIVKSMRDAILSLEAEFGTEPFEWQWDNLHTLTLTPPLFGEAAKDSAAPAALRLIVENLMSKGPYPVTGHGMTLNNGQYNWNDPYQQVLGASIRRIIDFSDLSSVRSILPTGQSGNPLSRHFGDQTDLWLNGELKQIYQDSLFFSRSNYETTRLIPRP